MTLRSATLAPCPGRDFLPEALLPGGPIHAAPGYGELIPHSTGASFLLLPFGPPCSQDAVKGWNRGPQLSLKRGSK